MRRVVPILSAFIPTFRAISTPAPDDICAARILYANIGSPCVIF